MNQVLGEQEAKLRLDLHSQDRAITVAWHEAVVREDQSCGVEDILGKAVNRAVRVDQASYQV